MAKKKRSTLPSRKKYDEANPVVSFRVSKELYDRLQVAKEKESMSYTDILKVGLGLIEVKMRAEEEIREQAYDEGREKGITDAIEVYMVTYPCSVCGKPIELDTPEEKAAASRYMREKGWDHAACHERARQP